MFWAIEIVGNIDNGHKRNQVKYAISARRGDLVYSRVGLNVSID